MKEYITAVSSWEGAEWAEMEDVMIQVPPPEVLAELRDNARLNRKNEIVLGHYQLHAFKTNEGRIWDVVNGWR